MLRVALQQLLPQTLLTGLNNNDAINATNLHIQSNALASNKPNIYHISLYLDTYDYDKLILQLDHINCWITCEEAC